MPSNPYLMRLISDHDEDESNGIAWMRDTDDSGKLAVWNAIQACGHGTMQELVCRFAQIGFCHIFLKAQEPDHAK